ncbi:MAG: glycosyltransferase [Alphaproteobacteria bacterium GM202ARS2]|nr:glycosyltransferase [Alphaproteobacteria bacterium GM202ARS2]
MLPLSCYIVARGRAVDITGTLCSVQDLAGDVVVLGTELSKRDEAVAKALGARIVDCHVTQEDALLRFAKKHCRQEWMLFLYANECLSQALRRELVKLFRQGTQRACYRLASVDVYPVRDYPLWTKRRWQPRLYRLVPPKHQRTGQSVCGRLHKLLLKKCPPSFEDIVAEQNTLSSRDAVADSKAFYGVLCLRLFTESLVSFLRAYLWNRHILGGLWGFAYSVMQACHSFTGVVKKVEQRNGWHKMPKISVKSRKLKTPLPISCCIIAKNEADRIVDIVVVDGGSSDDTVAVARSYGARVVKRAWQGYGVQKRFAEAQCRYDWVLNMDADEWPSVDFLDELQEIIALPEKQRAAAYRVRRVDCYSGEATPRKHARPWSIVRFYDRRRVRFNSASFAEEVVVPKGLAVAQCKQLWYHYPIRSMDDFWSKENRTTSWVAPQGKPLPVLLVRLFIEYPFTFVRMYLIKGGYKDGLRGFIRSQLFAFVYALRIIKKLEYRLWAVPRVNS